MRKVAVYAGTRNLYNTMRVAVKSLTENNKMDAVYLFIEDDIFPYSTPDCVQAINISRQEIFPADGPNYTCQWTYMSLIRLALAKLLPTESRVLWLDCDTIVDGDLTALFETNLRGRCFGMVREFDQSRKQGRDYYNAGVILMDLDKIRTIRIDDLLIWYVNNNKLDLPDQDTINNVADMDILGLPSMYNVCQFTEPTQEAKIYHFAYIKVYDNIPVYKKYSGEEVPVRTLIAVPCFDTVFTDFMRCMLDLEKPEGTNYTVIKNTLIYQARNFIAQNAIRYGFDRVLWLDSDIVFEPDTLTRLAEDMDKGLDFVSGLYFMRKTPTQPVIYSEVVYEVKENEAYTGATPYADYPEGLFEVAGAGFGCCMTSVELLKKLVERYGAPFTPMMGLGEDVTFCWRARQMGAKLWCDSRIKLGHIGTVEFNEDVYRGGKQE